MNAEGGFTLTELLVSMVLFSLLLLAVAGVLDLAVRQAPRDQERAHVVRTTQVGVQAMTRELRQAYQLNALSGSQMDVLVRSQGTDKRVVYRCDDNPADPDFPSYRRCIRQEASAAPGAPLGAAQIKIERVLNGSTVFSPAWGGPPATPPAFVRVQVRTAARGERKNGFQHAVVLDDGVFLRNLKVGS